MHAEKGRDNVQHNTEHYGDQLHVEEGEEQVKLNPEHHEGHLHAEEGEDSVKLPSEHAEEVEEQIPPERIGGHLQAEEVEYKVQLISDVSTGHIFSLDFWTNLLKSKIIHPFTFTDSFKLRQISETLACIWSFTFTFLK